MRVFVVGTSIHYANWIQDVQLVDDIKKADIVLFTGGEDVDPSLYGAKKHPTTYSNPARDEEEKHFFSLISNKQLAVGICRGLN